MMSMLAAGGREIMQDGVRTADEDNPKGYYEFEQVKKIKEDASWLPAARGKVVKMISQLLLDLPRKDHRYKVIFMRRNIDEILESQKKMLVRRGTYNPDVKDDEIRRMFIVHLDHIATLLRSNACFDTLYVNYNKMMAEPAPQIDALNQFLGGDLNVTAMAAVVDKNLYRNRASGGQAN